MKKMKFNLEDLKVESFQTSPETENEKGTVFGYGATGEIPLQGNVRNLCYTDFGTTCSNTCFGTCGSACWPAT